MMLLGLYQFESHFDDDSDSWVDQARSLYIIGKTHCRTYRDWRDDKFRLHLDINMHFEPNQIVAL